MTKQFEKFAKSLADSLTTEQAIKLIEIASPLTDVERAQFDAMTDDELLAELLA